MYLSIIRLRPFGVYASFMKSVLDAEFFGRPVLSVSEELLGKFLCTPKESLMITEVEAYDGQNDMACHARFGKTKRTEVMFGPAGHWYVNLCYGMYWMLNVVCGEEGYPAAVLIRGVEGDRRDRGNRGALLNGPGKLTKTLSIDRRFNGLPATKSSGLWIEDRGVVVPKSAILKTPRVGVDYAREWAKKPWRFVLRHSEDASVSRRA